MIFNPFEQFEVQLPLLFNYNIGNITHYIRITDTVVVVLFIIALYYFIYLLLSFRKRKASKSFLLIGFKELYSFVYKLVYSYLGKNANTYFPFYFYLFLFICTSNVIGILPYSFTITSHLSITFTLSFIVWFACIIVGFEKNGAMFFLSFFPRGVPFALVPFLVGVETISYIFRSVSLALRLFANIVAGHISLDTLALFIHKTVYLSTITFSSILIAILPFIMCIVLILFELVVACLQGYIFLVLACIYLKDTFSAQNH